MLKKTIKYTDYNGDSREEDFYFNLNKAELIQMNFTEEGGLENTLRRIIKERDIKSIGEMIQDIILRAYGEKSIDGRRFVKTKEMSEEFKQTEAFSELYIELLSDVDKLSAFITGALPPEFSNETA